MKINLRFRFSIRALLLSITIASLLVYLFFVRPTINANQFAQEVQSGNYSSLANIVSIQNIESVRIVTFPRDWGDFWLFRRRMIVYAECKYHAQDDGSPEESNWTTECYITVGLAGVRVQYNGQFETK